MSLHSYPYLTLLSSLVSCAAHFAFKLDQSLRSLLISSITDSRNLTILLGGLSTLNTCGLQKTANILMEADNPNEVFILNLNQLDKSMISPQGHWALHAYGILAITELRQLSLHLSLLTLVPLPALFYILTARFGQYFLLGHFVLGPNNFVFSQVHRSRPDQQHQRTQLRCFIWASFRPNIDLVIVACSLQQICLPGRYLLFLRYYFVAKYVFSNYTSNQTDISSEGAASQLTAPMKNSIKNTNFMLIKNSNLEYCIYKKNSIFKTFRDPCWSM